MHDKKYVKNIDIVLSHDKEETSKGIIQKTEQRIFVNELIS